MLSKIVPHPEERPSGRVSKDAQRHLSKSPAKAGVRPLAFGRLTSGSRLSPGLQFFRPISGRLRGADADLVGEADQLGDAGGLHLPHDLTAVHLDRHLANPELAGDLLVEPAGDD